MSKAAQKPAQQASDTMGISDILSMCLSRWWWFVISVIICLGAAVFYLLRTPNVYTSTAAILIKSDKSGRSMAGIEDSFTDLNGFSTNTNVNNEMETMRSPDIMTKVVRSLGLDKNYFVKDRFKLNTLYGPNLPVDVQITETGPERTISMTIDYDGKGNVTLSDFVVDGALQAGSASGPLGTTLQTPAGELLIEASGSDDVRTKPQTILFSKTPVRAAADSYASRLVLTKDKETDIIRLSINDVSTKRAEDILNGVIKAYNENWVTEKNQIAVSTSLFINDRLGVIEDELGDVDTDISQYKSENLLPDVNAAASMAMQQASNANAAVRELDNQLYMARYARNYLANSANNSNLLPISSGIADPTISGQIAQYNQQLMDRNSLLTNTSETNPMVQEMDENLNNIRSALLSSIDNHIMGIEAQARSMRGFGAHATSQIASNPKQSKYLLSVERQQKVKESLYLYLLQKREENELSQAFTAYNTRIVVDPRSSFVPTSPQKSKILLIAFVLGLAIPFAIIYLKELMYTKVRGRKDLENMTAPLVGEIPQARFKGKKAKKGKKGDSDVREIVVKPKSRNSINEAFRMVRTNLEFMTTGNDRGTVVAVTSANPGSGKTFTTYNLALSFAIKEKRVLIIDLDLRKGSMSKYVGTPKPGITDYLVGRADTPEEVMYPAYESMDKNLGDTGEDTTFYLIPVGTVPPNPTELLFNERLKSLIEEMRDQFDYIFIDCPPVEVVADASIINKLVDQTIFIIRAGLLERAMLNEIENFYVTKKYNNMILLLNGTIAAGRYGYKYGYKYGYRYGYKYGYSTDYTNDKDE